MVIATSADEPAAQRQRQVLARVDAAIGWYDEAARHSMTWYFWMKGTQIVAAALVPVAVIVTGGFLARVLAGLLGALVVIVTSFENLHHYHEHYVSWRFITEQLTRERHLYTVRAGPYATTANDEAALLLLVSRTESLTGAENQAWMGLQAKSEEPKGGNTAT